MVYKIKQTTSRFVVKRATELPLIKWNKIIDLETKDHAHKIYQQP